MTAITSEKLAGYIDHTLLKATATSDDIRKHCRQARQYGFAAVSLNARWVSLAADILADTNIKVDSVVSLPLGADTTAIKASSAKEAIYNGADEIDMVADIAAIIEKDQKYLTEQFNAVLKACRSMKPAVPLKVIIESAAISDEQKIFVCQIASQCGVDFVKTSTGMNSAGGATVEDVKLMKQYAPNCKVKAAGGIRTAASAMEMITAGADRIGTSASVEIIQQLKNNNDNQ